MAEKHVDVAVLGGGLAGSLAAWIAARAGRRVVLLRRGGAATAVSSGALDLVADPDTTSVAPLPNETGLEVLVEREIARNPAHLFSLLTSRSESPGQRAGRLLTAFSLARRALEDCTGLPFAGDGRQNLIAVTQAGTLKQTALLQASMELPEGDVLKKKRVGFCGIRGIPGWDGERAAQVFGHLMSAYNPPRVRGFDIELDESTGYNANALGCASLLEDSGMFDRVIEKIRVGVGSATFDILVVPPVFGFMRAAESARRAGEKLGCRVAESVSSVPSVPGMRLQLALDRALSAAGVETIPCDIVKGEIGGGVVSGVAVRQTPGEPAEVIRANDFVLATGKFAGGGMIREKRLRESVFGLPVFLDGREILSRQSEELFSRAPEGPHPAFRAGVAVGPDLRPLDGRCQMVARNLVACGNILSGYDYLRGGTGLGAALLTGYLAGEQLAAGKQQEGKQAIGR